MRALIQDYVPTAEILNTATIVTATGHPIENIQDSRLAHNAWIAPDGNTGDMFNLSMYNQKYNFNYLNAGSAIIQFDFGSIVDIQSMAIAGNNFTNFNIAVTWSTISIDSVEGSFNYLSTEEEWVALFDISDIPVQARYVQVIINDAQQVGNWIAIGRISIGVKTPLPDTGPIYDVDYISNAARQFSLTRQLYGGPRVIYRRVNITFPVIDDTAPLVEFYKEVDIYKPFYMEFDECLPQGVIYGALSENTLPFNYNHAGFFTSRISIEEVF